MTKQIGLVVADLDGTHWDRARGIHYLTLGALQELDRRGLHVLAATARRPASARRVMQMNGLTLAAVLAVVRWPFRHHSA